MSTLRRAAVAVILSGIAAILALPPLLNRSSASVVSLALGTDDAFSITGLEPRENQIGGGAIRWMRPKAAFQFVGVGPGRVDVEVEVRDHRSEVTLVANGARIGSLPPGQGRFTSRIQLSGPTLVLGMDTEGFAAPGRTLGTRMVSIRVQPVEAPGPGPSGVPSRLWLALAAVLLVSSVTQAFSGLSVLFVPAPAVLFLFMVLPAGLWRSGWLVECGILVMIASVFSALVSARAKGGPSSRGWLQVAVLLALTVHGLLPPSPLVTQSDVQLHGNKLAEVAKGNWFPTSRTDHQPPFEIPYGFSFYGVLTPFASQPVENVRVVREVAALFSALSVLALALCLGRASAGLAAASTILWTFAPVNIRTMGFGNLSNVFAQAVFLLFLVAAGLMRKGRARAGLLSLLVALSATAHLSSFIVLLTLLLVSLVIPHDRHNAGFKPLLLGMLVAGSYYSTFLPMIVVQLPRLPGERGGSSGVFDPWRLAIQILAGAGWPLLALIALSLLAASPRFILPLARSVIVTGLLLAILALISPVEVRYLLAVLPLMAIVGASVFDQSDALSFPKQNLTSIVDVPWLRTLSSEGVALPLGLGLLVAAIVRGMQSLLEFIPLSGA